MGIGVVDAGLGECDLRPSPESKVVESLTDIVQNALLNVATILLGVSVGATMDAATFLRADVLFIFALGLVAFAFGTASGVPLVKAMNLFTADKINPLVGAAGVSAVPMAARVAHRVGAEADRKNYLLMSPWARTWPASSARSSPPASS